MNKLLAVGLGLMILFMIVSQSLETNSNFYNPLDDGYTQIINGTTGEYIINGTDTNSVSFGEQNLIFNISLLDGIMITLVVIGILVGTIGIKVLDSGLSEFSQKGIVTFSIYGGFWGIFSILTYDLVIQIAIFGWITFLLISMVYFFGTIQNFLGDNQ